MDQLMTAEGDRQEKAGYPLIKWVFQDIHEKVYLWGKNTALSDELAYYIAKNSTDGQLALGKFAATAVIIDWRVTLDQERRTVHPTQCKNEAGGWTDWNTETNTTLTTLRTLIPKLHELKSEYWAHQHQRVSNLG